MPNTIDPSRDPRTINWHNLNYQALAEQAVRRYNLLKASGQPVQVLTVDPNTGERHVARRPL